MLKIIKKEFSKIHLDNCEFIKNISYDYFNIITSNNICLLLNKIQQLKNTEGAYVECGTFKGGTLLPVALYTQQFYINKNIYGIDSFEGFPITKHHKKDLPLYFKTLYSKNLISKDHFEKAKIRTQNFKSIDHLEGGYFKKINSIFENVKQFSNVNLIKGVFSDTTPKFNKKISLLHLDCDLYESYLTCLTNLYNNIVSGGVIVFDEYYSHKYPGARVAVDEFFKDKKGYFEYYITKENHERWCFIKE